jgi:hypothetical protein
MFQDQQEYQPELWETPYESAQAVSPMDEIMGEQTPMPALQAEAAWGLSNGEYPGETFGEYPGETFGEYPGETFGEYPGEAEAEYPGEAEAEYPGEAEAEYPGEAEAEYPGEMFGEFPGETEAEYPGETEAEYPGEAEAEYPGEMFGEYPGEYEAEYRGEYEGEDQELMSEDEELALAAELMDVRSEAEMEQFLGKLFRKIASGATNFLRSPAGQKLGNVLRQVARKYVIPIGARAIGGLVGGPPGAMIGGQLAGPAAQAMGLEVGGLSEDEAQFSIGRQFIRLAYDAARRAAAANPQLDPDQIVRFALSRAARRYAPGLLSSAAPRVPVTSIARTSRGVWVRRGRTIVLFGV